MSMMPAEELTKSTLMPARTSAAATLTARVVRPVADPGLTIATGCTTLASTAESSAMIGHVAGRTG